ncbi:MAG TPA: hypothetical protein VM115_15250 [Vicinamibacterales bacterium]|nr:hypothetical protein [Vicinamibacterales bacterium]
MRRIFFCIAAMLFLVGVRPGAAQQNELASLRAEIAKQQVVISQLLRRIEALEKPAMPAPAGLQDVQDELKATEDSVNSLRETVNSKVNLNGYYNFRFSVDGSEEPMAFQQHHLGVLMSKQLGKFNFLMELELQNVPHHPEITGEGDEHEEADAAEEGLESDISGEGQVAVENAWMEYNHNRLLSVRVGKQLSPQYWWQNHYPNLTLSTALPIYLRELFPAELVGVTVQGSAASLVGASEFGVGYKFYVANNNFEGNSRTDRRDGKSWGARGQLRFPTGGALRRFDVAADVYRGHVGLSNKELADDNVVGFETQLEISRFLLQTEWARGKSLEMTRTGYYVQPAIRLHEDWMSFYRIEELDSPRIRRAERRHIAGLNYRPYPQIALKGEFYRSQPLDREFMHEEEDEHKPFNGFATAAVFFF